MANPRFAWGIDVGNGALKAIKLVSDGDRLRVDDLEVIEHEQILSNAGDNKESLIQTALANFVQHHPVKGGVVGISVSGQSSFARFIKLPPVEARKVPEIVRFEAIQQIPFPLDDVEWSYQLFQEPESPDIEVGIFAMRKELVRSNIQHFTNVGMDVQVVQMSPLAVYNAMYYDQRFDGTTMIVDLGAENTDLIIADGETVWLRTIPIGGNNFSEVLAKQFKLNSNKAEELKRNARTSKYARQIFQAMRPIFADLVAEIQRSIGFYASVHRESRIKRIIALGGTFRLPTLMKYLQQNLQIEVQQIDGFGGGAPTDGRLATTLNENLISMAGAYGLAVQAMGAAKITSSLLPEPIRRAKIWREKAKWFAAAAAIIVAGTAGVAARYNVEKYNYDSKPNADARQQIDGTLATATTLDKEWSDLSQRGAPDRQKIRNVTAMVDYRDVWPALISDIRAALPPVPGDPQKIKSLFPTRSTRRFLTLTELTSRYDSTNIGTVADVSKTPADATFVAEALSGGAGRGVERFMNPGMQPGQVPARGTPGAPVIEERGFYVVMGGTTPNAAGAPFLDQTFVRQLKALTAEKAREMGRPYYIKRVAIANLRRVKDAAAGSGPGGAMAFRPQPVYVPPTGISSGGVNPPVEIDPYLDPLFNETAADDWEFKIVAAVILDPPEKTEAAVAAPATPAARPKLR